MTRQAPEPDNLPVLRADALDAQPAAPSWLVRDLWGHLAVGWIAGQPKSCKSWLGLELALSVASGTPCLDYFPVEQPGPALIYLAEDSLPNLRERIPALCAHHRLSLAKIELYVIAANTLRLDDQDDQARLARTIACLRPRLLLLDPLIRLHLCDENAASEMAALLGFLRALSRQHQLAIVLVHHMSKKNRRELGQAMRGSIDMWAWSDSAAYLTRHKDHLLLTLEHRSAPPPAPVHLRLVTGQSGPHLERIAVDEPESGTPKSAPALAEQVRVLLGKSTTPLSRVVLRAQLRVQNHRLGEALAELERQGIAERTPSGWTLSSCRPPAAAVRFDSQAPAQSVLSLDDDTLAAPS
jgi:hypothetical protein